MAKKNDRSRNRSKGIFDMARERPVAAVAAAAGAAATGLFLWSKRAQISDQLGQISEQLGEWSARSNGGDEFESADETTGQNTSARSAPANRRARTAPTS
jgi:hypothetical protein